MPFTETVLYKDHVIWWGKDLKRSIDYLESREDINSSQLAYYGVSWGGGMGALMIPIEKRFKAGLLYVAGLMFQKALPEVDQINYVTRINIPTIMMNGKYDHFFPLETSQQPVMIPQQPVIQGGNKKIRKHRGIHQTGKKAGKLKKGYKYSGKRLKNGKAQIIKVKKSKK